MKNLIILGLIAMTICSCSKSKTDNTIIDPGTTSYDSSFVKFKLDGVQYMLSSSNQNKVFAHHSNTDGVLYLKASNNSTDSKYGDILLSLPLTTANMQTGVAKNLKIARVPTNPTFTLSTVYNSSDILKDLYMIHSDIAATNGTLTITKIKSVDANLSALNGTFSGTISNSQGATKTITEGEFFDFRTK